MDPRAEQLAEVIVTYSISCTPDDVVIIQHEEGLEREGDLLERRINSIGAQCIRQIIPLDRLRSMIDCGNEEEMRDYVAPLIEEGHQCTSRIRIDASTRPDFLDGADLEGIALYNRVIRRPYLDATTTYPQGGEKKWNVCCFPTPQDAQRKGFTFEDYANFVYSACLRDWPSMSKDMSRAKEVLDAASTVRILIPALADLTVSLEGREAEMCTGTFNMPDGEFFYGPVEDSANGFITFPHHIKRNGNDVRGVRLDLRGGEVTAFQAQEGQDYLETFFSQQGCRRIGEFGVGMNYGIERPSSEILFDEKIGGTVHFAFGSSYKLPLVAGGGLNEGEDHWDMICDLRQYQGLPGGKLFADGKLVQENGKWLI